MTARVPTEQEKFVAQAVLSGLRKFRDPLASIYVLMDILTLAFGQRCLIRIENEKQIENEPDTGSADWSQALSIQLIDLKVSILPANATGSRRALDRLAELPGALDETCPGLTQEIGRRVIRAEPSWLDIPELTQCEKKIADVPESQIGFGSAVIKLIEDYQQISSPIECARIAEIFTVSYSKAGHPRFCRLFEADDTRLASGQSAMGALARAYSTGFAHWSERGPASGGRWLAVPCTIANAAWVIILCECKEPYWKSGLAYYRDTLARLLEAIRMAARSAYVDQVLEVLEVQLESGGWAHGRLNDSWQRLGSEFPFAIPRMTVAVADQQTDRNKAILLSGEYWWIRPEPNPNFRTLIKADSDEPWGDIGDLADSLQRSIRARLRAEERAKGDLAQSVAHEYKNLTRNVSVLAERVATDVNSDVSSSEELRAGIGRLALQVKQLSRLALALFELTKPGASQSFVRAYDMLEIFRSALRIMLYIRSSYELDHQSLDVVDELSLEDAMNCLSSAYNVPLRGRGRRGGHSPESKLKRLLSSMPVQFLLFATHEPVNNMRAGEGNISGDRIIQAWTGLDTEAGECLLFQKTVEPADATRNHPSSGAERTNSIIPESFCRIQPLVKSISVEQVESADDPGQWIKITRVTRIKINGRPE